MRRQLTGDRGAGPDQGRFVGGRDGRLALVGQSLSSMWSKVEEGFTSAFSGMGDIIAPFMKELQSLASEFFKGSTAAKATGGVLRAVLEPALAFIRAMAPRLREVGALSSLFERGDNDRAGLKVIAIATEPQPPAADGRTVANYGDVYGEYIPYEKLPKQLIEAVVATEDRRFFAHGGIDLWGIARAMVVNARAGHMVQGGSTVTQQVAKNVFLTPER